jgi:hypothetical protein
LAIEVGTTPRIARMAWWLIAVLTWKDRGPKRSFHIGTLTFIEVPRALPK